MKKIFISYADIEKSRVKTLENRINNQNGFETIVIANNREPLKQLTDKVKKGIEDCDYEINEQIAGTIVKNRFYNHRQCL